MNNPKISVIAVNWHANDFAKLLLEKLSLKAKDHSCYEAIIVDNSKNFEYECNLGGGKFNFIKPEKNLGHGKGLEEAIKQAKGEYILALDIDAHMLLQDWDVKLIDRLESENLKLICAEGGQLKPIRPLFMFFRRETFHDKPFQAINIEGVKFDVGVHSYFRILSEHGEKSVLRLPWRKTEYEDVLGNEYDFFGERLCYHNWYGCRFYGGKDGRVVHFEIDGRTYEEFKKKKANLFKQV